MRQSKLKKIIQDDPSLVWYVKDHSQISDTSILEHILNYGKWEQVQAAIKSLGLKNIRQLYKSLVNKPRINIKPRVKHYFDLYFSHASRSTH